MVGPDLSGQGGISGVVKIWRESGFFPDDNLIYVSSASDISRHKVITMLKGLFRYVTVLGGAGLVYIHTAAYTSFYRKSLFILLARLFGRKIVLHVHPSEFVDFYAVLSRLPLKYCTFVLRRVDIFVVLTEEVKRSLVRLFPGKPVHLLRNGISLQEMRDRHGIRRQDGELLYLGWYIREKGVYELVDAVSLLKKKGMIVHLNFFGTKSVDQLREYIRAKGATDMISVNGWIGYKDKLRALYSSSMLILPSHSEGIPNVILEAMATRTPIVATFVGGMKEILRDEENALIAKVNDPADLSEKIARLLQDKDLAARLADQAYRQAQQSYDVPVIRCQFLKIIEWANGGDAIQCAE